MRAALAPLEKKHKSALESLLERAIRAKDLDGAVKIRAALESMSLPKADPIDPSKIRTARALRAALVGTTWTMTQRREDAATGNFLIRFVSETELQLGDDAPSDWLALDGRRIRTGQAVIEFDRDLEKYECADWYSDGQRFGVRKDG
ncbi:MAG TPA: hypothetical protein VMN36_01735 [Verrucomicrobiales bacterium]|nr:hypothetical protein [Verrucomicrobiales bacterium]